MKSNAAAPPVQGMRRFRFFRSSVELLSRRRHVALVAVVGGVIGVLSLSAGTSHATDHPTASIDWTMDDRFGLDENNDGLVDYFPETSSLPGLDGEIDPATFSVRLNGCASSGDDPIVSYSWEIAGAPAVVTGSCTLTRQLAEGTYPVVLTVEDDEGEQGVIARDVIVQDWLIVALGDSYGSGEGSPDQPVPVFLYNDLAVARQNLADAEDAYDLALADLLALEADFDDTVAAAAAVAFPCGWRDTNGNGTYDTWDLLLVQPIECAAALVDVGLQALEDSLDALGEALNDLVTTAQTAVDVASAATDLLFADVAAFTDEVLNLEDSLHATWQDRRCHRSARAGVAQAALLLEQSDPRTSVTFVHLACSGGEALLGLLEPYQGVDVELENPPLSCGNAADPGPCLPAQINEASRIIGDREIDVLNQSVGGNDANFAPIVTACIVLEPCHTAAASLDPVWIAGAVGTCTALVGVITIVLVPFCIAFIDDQIVEFGGGGKTAAEFFADGIAELEAPGLYQDVAERFAEQLPDVTDERIYITQYPNATQNDDGSQCPDFFPQNNLPGLSLAEGTWTDDVVTHGLNDQVEANAALEGWNFIGGVYDAFELHGYCADDHWIRRLDEAFFRQGNHTGVVHPNEGGQAAYRDLILPAWLGDLYEGGDLDQPRRPAQPPVADAGGPYSTAEGQSIQLDGNGSYSPDLDPFDYLWSPITFGNGSTLTGQTTAAPTLHAADNGSLGVTLTVSDDDGSDADIAVVNISNVAPTVSVGADATAPEGAAFSRSGSFTDPSSVDTHGAIANYGDGTGAIVLAVTPARTFALSHVYADNGSYTVTVCVIDDDFGSDCDALQVTVSNVAPTVNAGADTAAAEGGTVSLAPAGFNDKGTLDTHTATIAWGDGTSTETGVVSETPSGPPGSTLGANGTVSGSHVYADDGSYTATVCVLDDDGGSACNDLVVTVTNAVPSVGAGSDRTVNEGSIIGLAPATFNDPGTLDTHTATVNWGDGGPTQAATVSESPFGPPGSTAGADGTIAATHVYGDDGLYTVTVCVTDDEAATTCDTLTVTVLNVAPTTTIDAIADGAPFALVLAPIDVDASFTDPGFLDTHTATVDWGDGSPLQALGAVTGSFTRSHAYATAGFFTVTVTVTDDDGGTDAETAVIEIVSPAEALARISQSLAELAADSDTNGVARALIIAAIADLYGNNEGASANGAFTRLQNDDWGAAVEKIEQALYKLNAAQSADPDLDLGYSRLVLAWVAKSVALDIVAQADAVATTSGQRKAVTQAKALIAQGDVFLAAGNYAAAADKYQKAIGKVESFLN